MATREEVQKLAALARIRVSDAQLDTFTKEFDAILSYVSQLEQLHVTLSDAPTLTPLRNVMREDRDPHAPGTFTEKVAEQFPSREGDALVVKQVITHD